MTTETTEKKFIQKMEYQSGLQPLYVGEALPGTATNEGGWRIQFFEYDDGNDKPPTGVLYAKGDSGHNKIWDHRTGYSYS